MSNSLRKSGLQWEKEFNLVEIATRPNRAEGEELMATASRNIERARRELTELHTELLQLEKRVDIVRESLRRAIIELFGADSQAFPVLQEAALAARIADAVVARLPVPPQSLSVRKQYIREGEAAEYMGVKVSTLRAWRLLRSKHGPPFT
jgi:hypothetical protein